MSRGVDLDRAGRRARGGSWEGWVVPGCGLLCNERYLCAQVMNVDPTNQDAENDPGE
jgi:hypothetical protein